MVAGTRNALGSRVTIAIPVCQERVSPVLDTAARILLVTRRHGKELTRKEFTLPPQPTEALAHSLAELHVDVLLCAALSEALWRALERCRVRVRPHLCGEIEAILHAFDRGQLRRNEFRMPGCWGWHLNATCCRRRAARVRNSAENRMVGGRSI